MDLVIAAAQAVSLRGDVETNVEHHLRLAELAVARRASVVVYPELSLTGYELDLAEELAFAPDDARLAPLSAAADASGATLIVGAPVRLERGLHIGAFVLAPGAPPAIYTKHHVHESERPPFVSGILDPAVEVSGLDAALAICADINHPGHAARAAERGARLFLAGVVSAPDGYELESGRLATYARQHSMVTVMANAGADASSFPTAGRSAIWDDAGRLVARHDGLGAGLVLARRSDGSWRGEIVRA